MKKNRKWRRNERTEHSTQMKWTNHKTQQKTHTKKYYIYRETQWEMTGTGAIHIIEPSSKAIMGLSSSSSGLVVFFVWHSPALILSVLPWQFFLSCLRWIGRPKVVENVTTLTHLGRSHTNKSFFIRSHDRRHNSTTPRRKKSRRRRTFTWYVEVSR